MKVEGKKIKIVLRKIQCPFAGTDDDLCFYSTPFWINNISRSKVHPIRPLGLHLLLHDLKETAVQKPTIKAAGLFHYLRYFFLQGERSPLDGTIEKKKR